MRYDETNDIEEDEEDFDDPADPSHRDYDLSTAAPYDYDRPADTKPWYLQRWTLMLVGGLLILSLVLPYIWRLS